MPATRRQRSRSVKTMRAGAAKANSMAGHYTKFITHNLKQLDKAADALAPVFGGTNPDFIKKAGLAPAQKKVAKLFTELEKVENMLRDNKYYDHYAQ